ncbi:MAG: FadR family transcriptional regulator [Fuerstiella sp.]|nr:FadR family transcriptional regulator [Fuerstiella sp.]
MSTSKKGEKESVECTSVEKASLTDQAMERLTEFVLQAGPDAGWRLPPEHELCDRLGVGRSTLREATKVLEWQGLVRRVRGRGVEVVDRSAKATTDLMQLSLRRGSVSHEELLEVRTIYEVQAAALAAQRATREDLERIKQALDAMQAADTTNEQYIDADLKFHVAIAAATHNRVLCLIVDTILPLLRDEIVATLQNEKRPESRHRYHARIYKAIRREDAQAASAAMANHLAGAKAMLEIHQKQMESAEHESA